MTTTESVLGVSGVCRVGFRYPTQVLAFYFAALRALCRVCWVWLRACACVTLFVRLQWRGFFLHARTDKPNKPNTLNTSDLKVLICKAYRCVGFVLGIAFFVLGAVFRGVWR